MKENFEHNKKLAINLLDKFILEGKYYSRILDKEEELDPDDLKYFRALRQKIIAVKWEETENGDAKHDLKENLKKEKQLKTWLDNNSIHEIFEWFDAMEKIDICSPYYKKIWTTEVIERDKLFLSKLGIDLKNNS